VHNTQLFSIRTALAQQEAANAKAGPGRLAALFSSLGGGGGGASGGAAALAELFRLPPLLVTVQAFTMNLKGEDCGDWLARLIAAPVRSSMVAPSLVAPPAEDGAVAARQHQQQQQRMGLGTLFPSVGCQTLFLPATSREQLHNLAGRWVGGRRTPFQITKQPPTAHTHTHTHTHTDVPLAEMTRDFQRDLAALDEALLAQVRLVR